MKQFLAGTAIAKIFDGCRSVWRHVLITLHRLYVRILSTSVRMSALTYSYTLRNNSSVVVNGNEILGANYVRAYLTSMWCCAVLSLNGSPIARGYVNVGRATRFSESVARLAIRFSPYIHPFMRWLNANTRVGNQTTLLLRKLFVGAHLFYRPLATLFHCDDSIY